MDAIGVIGCGNMGTALAENLKKKLSGVRVLVFDKDKARQESLVKRIFAEGCLDIKELINKSNIIILAVKPQDIDSVLDFFADVSDKLIISIAAGIPIAHIESNIGKGVPIARAMPNINAMIGKGVTALSFNKAAGDKERDSAVRIFNATGEVVALSEEKIDAFTAIAGSGPAFVAFLKDSLSRDDMESVFIREAVNFNIEKDVAKKIASATIDGTFEMIRVNFDADILIKRVSSKGGTTEAGMTALVNTGKTSDALVMAIRSAHKRAGELARRK